MVEMFCLNKRACILRNLFDPCGDLIAKFAKNNAKDAKKQTKYLHILKKCF
ncbi:hypothetical protein TFUB4_02143 [Tannerella forsythia]|nr:hypothetical protein TFUB4_02143 [Tannerella forsythia]